jgi:hypothetical protein
VRLFDLPDFLQDRVTREAYVRWLQRKAAAHVKRDRKRGNASATLSEYKRAIHIAVCASNGRDAYTCEELDWGSISTYDNDSSKEGRCAYKAAFALLPTVDHIADGLGPADFAICGWRTNGAKGDLTLKDFVALCERVMRANRSNDTDVLLADRAAGLDAQVQGALLPCAPVISDIKRRTQQRG